MTWSPVGQDRLKLMPGMVSFKMLGSYLAGPVVRVVTPGVLSPTEAV